MPVTKLQLPPPANWQDFESLCRDLWIRIWGDENAQLHGRGGQSQDGVDIFGRPQGRGGEWAGVQCKLKDQGGALEAAEIAAEAEKADGFNPRLAEYVVATTAKRDRVAQEAARELTERHGFRVSVFAWEDIVERLDEHRDVRQQHYPDLRIAGGASARAVRRGYLETLWEQLYPVRLLGIGRGGAEAESVPLAEVYTALDVTADAGVEGPKGALDASAQWPAGDYRKRLEDRLRHEAEAQREERSDAEPYRRLVTALETAAAAPRLVLLGPAGSGKSTFARHLALCLAGEALGRSAADLNRLECLGEGETRAAGVLAWPHGALLPAFVELKQLVASRAFPADGEDATAGHLLDFLEAPGAGKLEAGELLREAFAREDGALLILDGLDEAPAAEQCRERIRQMIAAFCARFPHCRVLVTCRPYAYEPGSAWRLEAEGFHEAGLAPFDDAKAQSFIAGWYDLLARRQQIDAAQAEKRSAALWREIRASAHLKPLAERPLLLTMMADLHATSGGRLPGGRAGLYERSVELLLDRWNEVRGVLADASLSEHLGMSVQHMRQALEGLAYEVHRDRAEAGSTETAEIAAMELFQALDARRRRPLARVVDERRVMDYLHQRSGILTAESEQIYRFPHRSFQEYLAACHLVRTGFPQLLATEVKANPALWREVLLLAAGKVAETPFMAWTLFEELVRGEPGSDPEPQDPGFLLALYAALATLENELWHAVEARDAPKLARIRLWLERSLEVGALSPVDRAAGGRVLAVLGDRRPGVGLRDDGVPDVDWVKVPAGSFRMGSTKHDDGAHSDEQPQHDVELERFSISRHPVTNAHYQAFVDDGGYTDSWRECWTDAGWKWKGDRQGPNDQISPDFLLPNHPRVNVTWFEADAFSRWLGRKLGADVRLPTEAEWEKAARGTDGQIYPWGNDFEAERCNVGDTRIGKPSPVGMFPSGASPYGVLDMSGNVREWTLSKWSNDYRHRQSGIEASATMEEIEHAESTSGDRVYRGGSYWDTARDARCAYRNGRSPEVRDDIRGLRVLLPAPRGSRG